MAYRLRPRLTVCMVAGQAVFLDLERDRYFSLGGPAAEAIEAMLAKEPPTAHGAEKLLSAGLVLQTDDRDRIGAATVTAPTRSLLEEGAAHRGHRIVTLAGSAVDLVRVRRGLRVTPFAAIIDKLAARKTALDTCPHRLQAQRFEVAAACLAARRYLPLAPRCLPDSLALLDGLARLGLGADLVLGVKLNPFSAHCWVQAGEVVLNDVVDHATLHTPILVV